jgi:uncharacterized damage-inducible protein DinB
MGIKQETEFWLRGPVSGIAPGLQPAAHAILQARMEVQELLESFPAPLLWVRPGGAASVGFHVQHMAGVLDRLFTYAKGDQLSPTQLEALQKEGKEDSSLRPEHLLGKFHEQVETAIKQLKSIDHQSIFEVRYVGRKKIPSNVLGLLFHAAEHIQRHTGQLLVTAKVLTAP